MIAEVIIIMSTITIIVVVIILITIRIMLIVIINSFQVIPSWSTFQSKKIRRLAQDTGHHVRETAFVTPESGSRERGIGQERLVSERFHERHQIELLLCREVQAFRVNVHVGIEIGRHGIDA